MVQKMVYMWHSTFLLFFIWKFVLKIEKQNIFIAEYAFLVQYIALSAAACTVCSIEEEARFIKFTTFDQNIFKLN